MLANAHSSLRLKPVIIIVELVLTLVFMLATRVSNGAGQDNFSGQRDRRFFIVPGQKDNGISSTFCHGTLHGTERTRIACQICDKTRNGTITFFHQNPGRDAGLDGIITIFSYNILFWNIFSYFRTSYSVLECTFPG